MAVPKHQLVQVRVCNISFKASSCELRGMELPLRENSEICHVTWPMMAVIHRSTSSTPCSKIEAGSKML